MTMSSWRAKNCDSKRPYCAGRLRICAVATPQKTAPAPKALAPKPTQSKLRVATVVESRNGAPHTKIDFSQHDDGNGAALLPPFLSSGATDIRKGALATVKSWFLPAGFPDTVTADYLAYQLWAVPAHITGWISVSLTTSSMLTAVGVGAGAAGTVAAGATIRWILKDGIGALGRFIVGGRLGQYMDEDPKRVRMAAEFLTSFGLALEIALTAMPNNFLLLAGGGTLARAVGKGMGRPAFRVIETHFAAANNVGDIFAKEEVWEVAAQLVGLGASVLVLKLLENHFSAESLIEVWLTVQVAHVLLRYKSLSVLQLRTLNKKRAWISARQHVQHGTVPDIAATNAAEPFIYLDETRIVPAHIGVSLHDAFGGVAPSRDALSACLAQHDGLDYFLVWREGTAWVVLTEAAKEDAMLQALWQAAWLHEHSMAGMDSTEAVTQSVSAVKQQFRSFRHALQQQGWQLPGVKFRPELDSRITVTHHPSSVMS